MREKKNKMRFPFLNCFKLGTNWVHFKTDVMAKLSSCQKDRKYLTFKTLNIFCFNHILKIFNMG